MLEHDVAARVPAEWLDQGRAAEDEELEVTIAVKLTHVEELEALVYRVSDPSDVENYGKHLSMEEVTDLVAPSPQGVKVVVDWLHAHGVQNLEMTRKGAFITIATTVNVAEELFDGHLHAYRHASTGARIIRLAPDTQYSAPVAAAAHIDFMAPTVRFPRMQRSRLVSDETVRRYREAAHAAAKEAGPGAAPELGNGTFIVVPTWLRELYQLADVYGKAKDNLQCVCSFIGQFYSDDDLQEFFGLFFNSSKGQTPRQIGQNDPSNVGLEASLDVQYLMSIGADIPTEVWYTPGENTPFLNWIVNVTNAKSLPHIFSFSYGDNENGVSAAYANRINTQLATLGARGVSLLVASGDSGVGGNCSANGDFSPDFPATSPYVTAVGGLVGGNAGKTPTGEWADLISGGGFSTYFPRPSYQDAAVAKFFATNKSLPNPQYYNKNGAGYPDIAAQSESFVIVSDRIPLPGVGGTSCATPTSSGVFSHLNDLRLQAGKPVLGWLNPFIYQTAPAHANAFNDATAGGNEGCNNFIGFTAVPGWDPVTGWGSPNYRLLAEIVATLP